MNRPVVQQQVTFVYTRDLAASADFYATTLGLPLVLDQGLCRIYRVGRDAFLGVCHADNAPQPPQGIILTLVSDDVDGWYDYLRGRGVAVEKPPTFNATYNIYHLFLRDPAGYLVEIQTFRDPAWPAA